MNFGYLRVSTQEHQDFERQLHILNESGYEIEERNLFYDKVSGKSTENREQYQIIRKIVRNGDTVVFTELSRFSRNYNQIAEEMLYFKNLNVRLVFLDMPFLNSDSDDLTQQLISDICIKLFAYVAQTERENTSKRFKQKLDSMKAAGIKLGRPAIHLNEEQIVIMEQYISRVPEPLAGKVAAQLSGLNINSFYKQLRLYKQSKKLGA